MPLDESEFLDAQSVPTDAARKDILKFLNKVAGPSAEKESTLSFTLYLVVRRQAETPVRGFDFDFERSIDELADEIVEAAVTDVMSARFARKTTYCIRLDGEKDKVNFHLEMPPRTGTSDAFGREFHPSFEGLTAQTMDQNQFLIEKIVELSGRQEGTLLGVIDRQTRELNDYKRSEIESRRAASALLDGAVRRDMLVKEFDREQDRKDKVVDGFKDGVRMFGPPLAMAALGPQAGAAVAAFAQAAAAGGAPPIPGMPGAGPSDEDLIDELVLSLEQGPADPGSGMPQKLAGMMKFLAPEDVAIFVELRNRSQVRRQERAREQAAAAQAAREEAERERAAQAQQPTPGQNGYYGPPPNV